MRVGRKVFGTKSKLILNKIKGNANQCPGSIG